MSMQQDHHAEIESARASVQAATDQIEKLLTPKGLVSNEEKSQAALADWIEASSSLTRALEAACNSQPRPLTFKSGTYRHKALVAIKDILGDRHTQPFTYAELKECNFTGPNNTFPDFRMKASDLINSLVAAKALIRLGRGEYLLSQSALSYLKIHT